MNKKFLSTLLLCGFLLVGVNANAEELQKDNKMPPPPPNEGYRMHKPLTDAQKAEMEKRRAEMDKRLGITEEQKAQLKAIHEKSKKEIAPKVQQLSEAEYELEIMKRKEYNKKYLGIDTYQKTDFSGKSQTQLENEVKTLRAEIRAIKKANFEESQKVFTDKQKKELEKMKQENIKKHQKMEKKMYKEHGVPQMPPPHHQGF